MGRPLRRSARRESDLASPGALLLEYGTRRGAVALGLETGAIVPGMLADFIAVNVHHPSLAGWNADDFLDVLFFGASADAIVGTWVQGEQVCS